LADQRRESRERKNEPVVTRSCPWSFALAIVSPTRPASGRFSLGPYTAGGGKTVNVRPDIMAIRVLGRERVAVKRE